MAQQQLHRVLISGGGTGGHIFPAIAIADAIKRRFPDCEILFVGAEGKMEMEKVPAAGYKIIGLPVAGLQRKLTLKNLSFPFKLLKSLNRAKGIIKSFQPQVAIGVGGYASGPTLRVAGKRGIPTLLQEQNSHPGLTNRILAKKASKICVAYEGMDKFFDKSKIEHTGNPVRKDLTGVLPDKQTALKEFGLNSEKTTLLVLGGSLGARTINESLLASINQLLDADIQIIWQCGKFYYDALHKEVAAYQGKELWLGAFIQQMQMAYAAADVVVSRAGALSVSELCVVAKPVIFIPSPNVAEDHQTKNALALTTRNAALMVKDAEAVQTLGSAIIDLVNNQGKKSDLSKNISQMAIPDADERIVDALLKMINP
jgi:UDP-N-acetylglucosamine--N-acetylmuramyl-(pentapeptide) pyrophosphoryl-undecaprenol N-acetylglucosamine transferase